jgi:hypothetical protein
MALDLIVDKIDGLSEPLRGLYVEKEGKFHLDVAGLEDTGGLKKRCRESASARVSWKSR